MLRKTHLNGNTTAGFQTPHRRMTSPDLKVYVLGRLPGVTIRRLRLLTRAVGVSLTRSAAGR